MLQKNLLYLKGAILPPLALCQSSVLRLLLVRRLFLSFQKVPKLLES